MRGPGRRGALVLAAVIFGALACSSSPHRPSAGSTLASDPSTSVATVSGSRLASSAARPTVVRSTASRARSSIGPPLSPTTFASLTPPRPRPVAPRPGGGVVPTIAGCSLFPADNPWRRDVSRDPVDPHSVAWVSSIGANQYLRADPSLPYLVVPAGQRRVPITFDAYGSESDPGPYPVPANAPIEGGSDRHLLVASGDCHLYELFGAARTGNGYSAASGAVFDLRSDRLRPDRWTSADAAGLPILPGLIRRDEVAAGAIDHALRFTVARTQRGYINPATHQAGSTTDPNVPPMGARFRLKASYDLSRFHGAARVILVCLQRYGMFVADNGANWFVSGGADPGWDYNDLNQLKSVPGSAFEAVATGPIRH